MRLITAASRKEKTMAMKSRYKDYAESIKKMQEIKAVKERKSTPGSILQKLKQLKSQEFSMTVPIGDANGK